MSGRRRGLDAATLRTLLTAAEGPYRLGVWWRNRQYDRREELVTRVEVPVVSVGNLTLGGSGKTPMVKLLARRLREHDRRVAIVSRGYGAEAGAKNDEALELEQALPDVPHVQNPDRVEAARTAIEELDAQIILMDDGFQHRRLARDLDLVLLDATEPFGFGRVFPRGALREPISSLGRATAICLTRSDMVTQAARDAIRDRVTRIAPNTLWAESSMKPGRLIGVADDTCGLPGVTEIESLRGRSVAAFCGIGNPSAFRSTLESLGAEVTSFAEFPDHHAYSRQDIETLQRRARGAEMVVCTHKDLVKVGVPRLGETPLWAVEIEAEITEGREALERLLDEATGSMDSR